ncbi:hypothetical protein GCM10027048_08560 [Hymenobacter coalescens]
MKHPYASSTARPLLSALALLLSLAPAVAQLRPAAILLRDQPDAPSLLAAALQRARPLALDVAAARAVLADAPPETQAGAQPLVLALPLPDGSTGRFAVWRTAVLAPALAARYPQMQTYAGRGLDDATATVRLDLTPAGFHAQILSATDGTVYIEPARRDDVRHYLSFYRRDVRPGATTGMNCDFQPAKTAARNAGPVAGTPLPGLGSGQPAAIAGGSLLRTYRLAVATTGEYAAFHGGTVPQTLAAVVTSVNRVVGVYERELAVRMVLVANNDAVIYTNAATDPYTNNNGDAMLDENQANLDAVIGTANYDIGHVFSTGGGGVAYYASVCDPDDKARGVTGSNSPVADAFDIDYVAHEMGHQFSGSHTFNSTTGSCNGNRSPEAAWEPGSGSTIMAYAGICSNNNLQPNSDPFFHVGSFEEMRAFIVSTPCPVVTATGNTPPAVSGPASGKTLPRSTPFKLTATGADADGEALTYNWEQIDRGNSASATAAQTANNNVPLFRSFVPTASPTRYFPRLSNLVAGTTAIGERLPTVTRRLTFQVTARDQHNGPLGVIGGVSSSDSVKLLVTSTAGPFVVTSPSTTLTWTGGTQQTVTWNVANTNAAPVSCATVNIRLSTDGGLTYPTLLALGVPNNGSALVAVPSVATTTARIMVEAADNYFFNISAEDFSISSPSVCSAPTILSISAISNTVASLSFTPGAATQYVVTTTPATTTQTVTAGPVTLSGLQPGTTYTVQVVADCGGGSTSAAATATFTTTAPPLCNAPSELAISNRTLNSATLTFVGTASNTSYTVTTVPATTTQTVAGGPVTLTGLQPATQYTVRVVGNCAGGATSLVAQLNFRTLFPAPANDLCANALPLTCGVRVQGTTNGATATADPTADCSGTSIDQGGVFYTLTGTGGSITISTCDAATDFDTKLFVYRGSCGSFTCLDGNDDSSCGIASTVSFTSVIGETYYVFVSGWDEEAGSFGLLATCAPLAAKQTNANAFTVWPNPAGGGAAFRVALPAPAAAATITLYNVLGQQVAQRRFAGSNADLSTTGLAPGTYLLTVQVADQAPAVRRVLVE